MTGRPRPHPGDSDEPPARRAATPRPDPPQSMLAAEHNTARILGNGRPAEHRAVATHPDPARPGDAELARIINRYEQLGAVPPRFTIADNDRRHRSRGAHTLHRHRPDMPLRRDPGTQTVEGRIYGDDPWGRPENWSHRWTDLTTMHRTINDYVRRNWETIRSDLALEDEHVASFDARQRIGVGYYNDGIFGTGPRNVTVCTHQFCQDPHPARAGV